MHSTRSPNPKPLEYCTCPWFSGYSSVKSTLHAELSRPKSISVDARRCPDRYLPPEDKVCEDWCKDTDSCETRRGRRNRASPRDCDCRFARRVRRFATAADAAFVGRIDRADDVARQRLEVTGGLSSMPSSPDHIHIRHALQRQPTLLIPRRTSAPTGTAVRTISSLGSALWRLNARGCPSSSENNIGRRTCVLWFGPRVSANQYVSLHRSADFGRWHS